MVVSIWGPQLNRSAQRLTPLPKVDKPAFTRLSTQPRTGPESVMLSPERKARAAELRGQVAASSGGGGGDWGKGLGVVINNPITRNIMKPLKVIDLPRRVAIGAMEEGALALPEWAEVAASAASMGILSPMLAIDEDKAREADYSWGERLWTDPEYGFGAVSRDTGIKWVDRAKGLLGDVALDPLTYASFGVAPVTSKAARASQLGDLMLAQRAAKGAAQNADAFRALGFAEDALPATLRGAEARAAQLGGNEALDLMGRRGVGLANNAQLEAMNLNRHGLRLRNPLTGAEWSRPLPGTERIGRQINRATGAAREAIKQIPGTAALRKVRHPSGFLDQDLSPAFERILTGQGSMAIDDAIEEVALDNFFRQKGGPFAELAARELDGLAKELKGMDDEGLRVLRLQASQGQENLLTKYADRVREIAKTYDTPIPRLGDDAGLYSMPSVLTRDFRNILAKAFETDSTNAKDFMRAAGMTTRDLLEDSGFRQKRVFRPGETIKIGNKKFEIETGTVDELNEKFSALFPAYEGKIYETNPLMAYRQYIRGVTRDVAREGGGRAAARAGLKNVQLGGAKPASFDPAGGRVATGGDLPDRAVMQEGGLAETPFYQGVPDEKATKARNQALIESQKPLAEGYDITNTVDRNELAESVRQNIKNILAPIRTQRDAASKKVKELEKLAASPYAEVADSETTKMARREVIAANDAIQELDDLANRIRAARSQMEEGDIEPLLAEVAAERAELVSRIQGLEAQRSSLMDTAATIAAEADELGATAAQRRSDLEDILPIDALERRAQEAVAALEQSSARTLSAADKGRLTAARNHLRSDVHQRYLRMRRVQSQIVDRIKSRGPAAAPDEAAKVEELIQRRAQLEIEVAANSRSGRVNSLRRQAQDRRRQATDLDRQLNHLADNLDAVKDTYRHYDELPGGFRTQKGRAARQRYLDLLNEREALRVRRANLLAEAQGLESKTGRIKDLKALATKREELAQVTKELGAARTAHKQATTVNNDVLNKRLAKLDTEIAPLARRSEKAYRDAFRLSGAPVADPELARTARMAAVEVAERKQARANIPEKYEATEVGRLKMEADLAQRELDLHTKAVEDAYFQSRQAPPKSRKGGKVPQKEKPPVVRINDDMARGHAEVLREQLPRLRAWRRLRQERGSLIQEIEDIRTNAARVVGNDGKPRLLTPQEAMSRSSEAARRVNWIDNELKGQQFEEITEAIKVIGEYQAQKKGIAKGFDDRYRRRAAEANRRYREAAAGQGRAAGGRTEVQAIGEIEKAAGAKAAEADRLITQIEKYIGQPIEQAQRELESLEAPARATLADNAVKATVGLEDAIEKRFAAQSNADLAAERLSASEAADLKEVTGRIAAVEQDLPAERQRLADMQQRLGAGPKASKFAGTGFPSDNPPSTDVISGAIADAQKIAALNADLSDPSLRQAEAALSTDAEHLARLQENELTQANLNKLLKEATNGKLGPVISAQLRDGWKYLTNEGDVVISSKLASTYKRLEAGIEKDPVMFGKLLTAYTNFFKTYATATLGFHVRNAMSATFMNLADGVSPSQQMRGLRVWREYSNAAKKGTAFEWLRGQDKATQDAFNAVFASGSGGRFFESGVAEAAEGSGRFKEKIYSNRITRASQRAGGNVEGAIRLGMAMDSIQRGDSLTSALDRLTRIHFDYSQTSKFDEAAKRWIPFWTFMSRNLPTQMSMMWTKPRVYNAYQSVVRNVSGEEDPLTPQYWIDKGAFKISGDIYLDPDLPFSRLQEDAERFSALSEGNIAPLASTLNPFFTAPVELATGTNIYTGYNTDADEMRKVGPIDYPAALLGAAFGQTQRGDDGSLYTNERLAQFAESLIPDLARSQRVAPWLSGNEQRAGTGFEGILRWLGAPYRELTDPRREAEAKRRGREELERAAMQRALAGG